VKVTDDNDHSPTFDADIYESSIEENNRQGATLFHVTASDLDIGDNGRIDYSIGPDDVRRFVTSRSSSRTDRGAVGGGGGREEICDGGQRDWVDTSRRVTGP